MTEVHASQFAFQALSVSDEPESTLFFVLDDLRATGGTTWGHGEPADGVAFVIGADGILATAAHVVWMSHKFPGDIVQVFCVSPNIPLRAKARVLSVGWRGPEPDSTGRMPNLPGRTDLLDERPDVVKEDIALLKLIPESILFDESRGGAASSVEALLSLVRVMPLGVPGYKPLEGAVFKTWCVERHFRAPRMVAVNGMFRVHERALHSAFQIEAPEIKPGFSGSPVWDSARRLAVGFVRSGASKRLRGAVRCTDARAIHQFADVPLAWDTDLDQVASTAIGLVTTFLGNRHEPVGAAIPVFVEPRARAMKVSVNMGLSDMGANGAPALEFIKNVMTEYPIACLCGGPGAGKSTVLRRIAYWMLKERSLVGRVPCIPLVFNARELPENFDLNALFALACRRESATTTNDSILANALDRNDVRVALLIDGLDEIERHKVARLLAHCQGLLSGFSPVFRVLLTTRPDAQLVSRPMAPTRPLKLIELLAFDSAKIEEYAEQRMADQNESSKFLTALRRVEWHQTASPLQLQMASTVFEIEGRLPSRESDLVFEYVRLRVKQGVVELAANPDSKVVPKSWKATYRPQAFEILRALALVSLQKGPQTRAQVTDALKELRNTKPFATVVRRPEECVDFACRDLALRVGLVSIEHHGDGDRLAWEHATFIDALAAEARLAVAGEDPVAVAALVGRQESSFGDRFLLTQLCAMDRAGWEEQVAERIEQAMEAPLTDRKEGLFALRALAAGVRLPKDLRHRVVTLLIRMALSPNADDSLCAELFYESAGLPRARDILQRDELRTDVVAAMRKRFWLRNPRRRGHSAPVVVTRGEASLLDLLQLWNEWLPEGLELAHPESSERTAPLVPRPPNASALRDTGNLGSSVIDRGGFEVVHRDSTVSEFEMPARSFLEGVVAMAQNLPPTLPPSQVVSLYLKGLVQVFDKEAPSGGGAP